MSISRGFIEQLEGRRLLSATSATVTDSSASLPGSGEAVATQEAWVPYVPTAQQTEVQVTEHEGRVVARVKIVFSDAGYRVTDWGTPTREGNRFVVDAKVERWTGASAQVITPVVHEYDLGQLEPGQYAFDFNAWGTPVESRVFTVPDGSDEEWVPYTPTDAQTSVEIIQREGRPTARVTITFPDAGFRVDWGTVVRDGNTLRADAVVDRTTGGAPTVVTKVTHDYDLGTPEDGTYTFEFAARGTVVERKSFTWDDGHVWVPYQPKAEQTAIEVFEQDGRWKARVTLTFSDNGFRVTDWGTVRREGNTFIADAKVERTGGPLPVVTTASHEYDLGELGDGGYGFNFNAWGKLVERKEFVVPGDPEEWVPYTPTAEQTEIRMTQEVGRTIANVTIHFPDSGFRVDWGTVRREGNTFIAEAAVDRSTGGGFDAITPKSHAYDLGELPAGQYVFEFRVRGTPVEREEFHPFEDPWLDWKPYTPTPEQTEIDVAQYQGKYFARVTVVFPDAGYRIDWGTLTRDGNTFRADAAVDDYIGPAPAVVTTMRHEYALGELPPGTYTFEFTARGEPVESRTFSVPVHAEELVVGGVSLRDEYRFFTDAAGDYILVDWNNDPAMRPGPLMVPRDAYDRFVVNAQGGDDEAVIDLVAHTPLPAGGMVYNGGEGTDVLRITGALSTDKIEISGNRVVINGHVIELVGVEKTTVDHSNGTDVVVGGDDLLEVEAGQHFGVVTVKDDAVLRFTGDESQVSIGALSISDGGLLDVRDKTVLITVEGSQAAALLAALNAHVAAGRAGGWTGGHGITSSVAAADAEQLYGVGVGIVPSPLATMSSVAQPNIQVIALRYTLKGDLNLDGVVTSDDYFRIDSGFLAGASTYDAGDVNYDGQVTSDDYFVVDSAFLATRNGTPAGTSAAAPATSAVAARAAAPFSRVRVADGEDGSTRKRRPAVRRVERVF